MQTPSSLYQSSPCQYPSRVPEPEYNNTMQVRAVHKHGWFSWNKNEIFLSEVLWGERIGLLPIDDRYYRVYFASIPIARLDTKKMIAERRWKEDMQSET